MNENIIGFIFLEIWATIVLFSSITKFKMTITLQLNQHCVCFLSFMTSLLLQRPIAQFLCSTKVHVFDLLSPIWEILPSTI